MAIGEIALTDIGNLVADPDLRYTPSGQAVANFTVANNPRFYDRDAGQWKEGTPAFLRCNVWGAQAENAAESLGRGMRVIVHGRLRQRNFETKDGEKRTVCEIEADEIGPALRFATAAVNKVTRTRGDGGPHPAEVTDDPWSTAPAEVGTGDAPPF